MGSILETPSLFIKNAAEKFEVYTDEGLVFNNQSDSPFLKWYLIPISSANAGRTLYIRTSYENQNGFGFITGIELGASTDFIKRMIREDIDYIVLGTFFFLIGISICFLFIFMRRSEQLAMLSLAFFAICGGLFTFTQAEIKQLFISVPEIWFYINTVSLFLYPVGIAVFVEFVFGGRLRFILRFLWVVNIIYSIFAIDSIIKNPSGLNISIYIPFCILVLVQFTLNIMMVARDAIKGNREALIFSSGMGIFALFLLLDLIRFYLSGNLMFSTLRMTEIHFTFQYGMFFFLLSLALILTLRFVETHNSLEAYSKDLEDKINERTLELSQERNKLKIRNEIMENELSMAREIQLAMIPSQSPNPNISFFYKSMDQVGGDFYDFIDFGDNIRTGIFLSDVSGHGVPAAFITSMIKSFILKSMEMRNDPAWLLTYLNDALVKQTGGNFITAFYGIYNNKTKEFTYSNAGHNPPYLIRNANGTSSGMELLGSSNKGIPLAVLSSADLQTLNKKYSNSTASLSEYGKLFLYTDGLVEAVNIKDKELDENTSDFESACLEQAVSDYRGLPAKDFVDRIVERLIEFRGSDKFEDDVCMICLDLLTAEA